jgi:hypothetical protein
MDYIELVLLPLFIAKFSDLANLAPSLIGIFTILYGTWLIPYLVRKYL